MNISGITGLNVILEAELNLVNGDFVGGRLIPIEQTGYGIPTFDSNYTSVTNICELISEDFRHPQIIILNDGRAQVLLIVN